MNKPLFKAICLIGRLVLFSQAAIGMGEFEMKKEFCEDFDTLMDDVNKFLREVK